MAEPFQDRDLALSPRAYEWASRAFEVVEAHLGLRVRLHDADHVMAGGHIFLFNHFARFETVFPPYLIYRRTGAYTRSIADHELFDISPHFSRVLAGVGAVPNDMPGLLSFLAAEILRGRKVSIFPEGGMVKDRAVVDPDKGGYSVFSRSAEGRRPHHRGAAILALTLDIFKQRILAVAERNESDRLERWRAALDLDSISTLLQRAREPTRVVPGYITFHPIRISDTFLTRAIDLFGSGLPAKAMEELLIESNLIFRNTDMDIRLGRPVEQAGGWKWWERRLIDAAFDRVDSLSAMFELRNTASRWLEHLAARRISGEADRLRDAWMHAMYEAVTLNLSHLAAALIKALLDRHVSALSRRDFDRKLYAVVKVLQAAPGAHLHPGLTEPTCYRGLIGGHTAALEQFLATAEDAGLVAREGDTLRFLEKLRHTHDFDRVRLENPIAVYANEAAPVPAVTRAVETILNEPPSPAVLALRLFDDERRDYEQARALYRSPLHAAINDAETATADGGPFLLAPAPRRRLGVLLIHGFLASPAEMRGLGDRLAAQGHIVLGARLAGHGTSPWDLRERTWMEWLDAARRGYRILERLCDEVAIVGFSAGGAIALALAAERPHTLAGVVPVCAPLAFRDRNMVFVPLVHGLNRVMTWWPSFEDGVMPFRPNDSEHPDINYRHMPVRGLYELRRLVAHTLRVLPRVDAPALILQADADPVVDPASARQILRRLGSPHKEMRLIPSDRHGILSDDIGGTQGLIEEFLATAAVQRDNAAPDTASAPGAPPSGSSLAATFPLLRLFRAVYH